MNMLVVGSGGREHALALKLAGSEQVAHVYVAPGNGGTDQRQNGSGKIQNVGISAQSQDDYARLVAFARNAGVGLTVIGPEAPLAAGISDAFNGAGLRCFGPSRKAARIEASKAFAKDFMVRHGIPTARFAVFSDYEAALAHVHSVEYPVVVKASGLAAGKGVVVTTVKNEAEAALREMMLGRAFGEAADEILIEERLFGQEASVLAFSDGRMVLPMPAAQDHKPVFDGDQGPNTGGMGAYAPAPLITQSLMDQIIREVLQPAVDGLRAEGMSYVGVLYAGLMITEAGPRVLEFNCRFGDPETEAILPLLEGDLVDLLQACIDGELAGARMVWRQGAAATIVAASGGYPGNYTKGKEIHGLGEATRVPGVEVYHAGTLRTTDGRVVTAGGRVLAVTGAGEDLGQALARAYTAMECIHFEGMHYRRDIGAKAIAG